MKVREKPENFAAQVAERFVLRGVPRVEHGCLSRDYSRGAEIRCGSFTSFVAYGEMFARFGVRF
jgi:hypothetical protein